MHSSALLLTIASLSSLSSAHFVMNYPQSIGFSDDNEGTAPCGGFTPDFSQSSQVVDFHVGGDALAMKLTHPQANWLFRATLDQKAGSNWQQIFPIVQQSGLGNFCEPKITLPESWAGKKGVISVVANGPDGILYQCIASNFVAGSIAAPSACSNATIKASFVDDAKLSALVSAASSSSGSGSSSTSSSNATTSATGSSSGNSTTGSGASQTSASTAASASTTKNAAPTLHGAFSTSSVSFGGVLTLLSMAVVGGVLMI